MRMSNGAREIDGVDGFFFGQVVVNAVKWATRKYMAWAAFSRPTPSGFRTAAAALTV